MSMTVGQLREFLAGQPDDRLVVLQKDAEGNGYSPLEWAEDAMYLAENTWSGDTFLTPEDLAEKTADPNSGWTEEDAAPDDAVRVLLLGPVN